MSNEDRSTDQSHRPTPADPALVQHYEIRVRGNLGPRWAAWFDGMTLRAEDDGTTVIEGPVVDQAALHGLLQKLRDLGITLLSLTPLPPTPATGHHDLPLDRTLHHAPGATS